MSRKARFAARSIIRDAKHPRRNEIDWPLFEKMGSDETQAPVKFSDESKKQIIDALDLLERNKTDDNKRINPTTLRSRAQKIHATIRDLPDHVIWENPHLIQDKEVFEYILVHTADEGFTGQSYAERAKLFLRLLRNKPSEMTLYLPSPEAMAVHLIREAFQISDIPAKVGHTRPSSAPEGSETLSAFERFSFEYVLPEIGSDPAGKKLLSRRLEEAERALHKD